ncbi:MAG: flagellar hook protein FlgE [Lachnospiraceae bacterium]|nr:flagellar hook protein FlgE [Lachnospiraceae bacterium]
MMRSLYSGVSGLKVHQTRMDVIGNNIANVNTVGFKSSSVTFSDVLYQTTSPATGPNADTGTAGMNAKQIGLGSGVSSIATAIDINGGSQRTDNPFDIMIEGSGFFVVSNGSGNYFTKAGSFKVDANGTLCNADGYAVMGWQVDPNNANATVADTVSQLKIMAPENKYSAPEATEAIYFSGNIDSNDTAFDSDTGKLTAFSFYDALGRSYTVNLKLTQVEDADGTVIENQYNVNILNIVDSTGKSIISDYDEATKTYSARDGIEFGFGEDLIGDFDVDELTGNLVNFDSSLLLGFSAATGKFSFISADGVPADLEDANYNSAAFVISTGDEDTNPFAKQIDIDFSSMTMFAQSGTTNISYTKGNLDGLHAGRAAGNMTGCSIDEQGLIYGVYDNGTTRLLGQVVVATFANPAGLAAVGGSLFQTTQNSGEFDGIGKAISAAGGSFSTGVLEMSNVDLATEFTNMITTQRGFQANSRIITTSDTLLEELINLKR